MMKKEVDGSGGGAKGVAVGTMTSSLRGCPGNGKCSPRRDADARRHRRRLRKNQFRPWLGDRSALARRCCDAVAAPLSLVRRREPRFSGGAGLPTATTAPPPRTTRALGAAGQAPAVAGGQLIERVLRSWCWRRCRARKATRHVQRVYTTCDTHIHVRRSTAVTYTHGDVGAYT